MERLLVQGLLIALCASFVLSQHLGRSELNKLYNTRVKYAQEYKRPLGSSSGYLSLPSWIKHAGVVVTTENGSRWLVHKGDGYGRSSQTVVTRASYMSSRWYRVGSRKVISFSTVGDYVKAGNAGYSLFFNNCLHAADRMMKLN